MVHGSAEMVAVVITAAAAAAATAVVMVAVERVGGEGEWPTWASNGIESVWSNGT